MAHPLFPLLLENDLIDLPSYPNLWRWTCPHAAFDSSSFQGQLRGDVKKKQAICTERIQNMASRCESKVHMPLADGQIRLLRLKPATTISDPIECSLFPISPTTSPHQYEAVSYVWGNSNHDKAIKVNTVDFKISSNLFELLPYLRQNDSDRVLWIDALCIDQTNTPEKSCQVDMMGAIYKGASHVIIFLGREWDGLEIVVKYLQLAAQRQDAHLDPAIEPHLHVDDQDISTTLVDRSLMDFFLAEWFFRVWTVQEFVLAKSFSFQYGSTTIAGDLVLNGFLALRRHVQNRCCGPLSMMKRGQTFLDVMAHTDALIGLRSNAERSFLETLHNLRRRSCKNPLDRVYGMLGMEFRGSNPKIPPDYSITPAQLFINVAQQEICHTRTLDIFSFFVPGDKTSFHLPSFVPDWTLQTVDRFTHVLCVDRQMTLSHYNASRGSQAEFQFRYDDSKRQATVNGILIDRIIDVGMPCFFSDLRTLTNAIPIVKEARRLAGLPICLPVSYGTASEREYQLWRTLCGNLAIEYLDGDRGWKSADPTADFDSYLRWYDTFSNEQDVSSKMKHDPFRDALIPNLSGRRFICTQKGAIGMADAEARSDDIVMVLAGGKVPYVLRKENEGGASGGEKLYKLVGDAYVDGNMQGEAVTSNGEWMEVTLI